MHVDKKVLWYRSFLSKFQSARPFSKCIFWQTTSKCLIFQINPTPRTSSLIDYRIVEKFRWVQFRGQICFGKNKTEKKWTKIEIDDVILCVCGAWPSTGRVWSEHHIFISAKMKNFSKESGSISAKFCTSENFPLYSICNIDFDLKLKLYDIKLYAVYCILFLSVL